MARRFFFVSLGILALSVAYHLGARTAGADWNNDAPGLLVGGDQRVYWTAAGEAWILQLGAGGWHRYPEYDLPVPASQVKFFDSSVLITTSDEAWTANQTTGEWTSWGRPGVPTPTKSNSWGDVKGKGGK